MKYLIASLLLIVVGCKYRIDEVDASRAKPGDVKKFYVVNYFAAWSSDKSEGFTNDHCYFWFYNQPSDIELEKSIRQLCNSSHNDGCMMVRVTSVSSYKDSISSNFKP